MCWPDQVRSSNYLQSNVVSLLPSIFTHIFSRTTGVLSYLSSLSHRSLCDVVPHHARCVLTGLRCNGHCLVLNFISVKLAQLGVLYAAPVVNDTEHLSFYRVLSCSVLPCRSFFGDSFFFSATSCSGLKSCPVCMALCSPSEAPSPKRVG